MDVFEEIYRKYQPDISRFLYRLTGYDALLTEELTQETFYQAYLSFPRFRGECAMKTWLCQIARNVYSKHIRREMRQRGLTEQLAAEIDALPLDLSAFNGHLRSYQAFGAKYVLSQRRVLLGDEMGLGKTVQAVAVMAHLRAADPGSRFLVVCPASVLVNWCREIRKFSALEPFLLHGAGFRGEMEAWVRDSGVAVTNYESMGKVVSVLDGRIPLDLLVIDEAHYMKNPDAQRTRHIRALDDESARILMMTGTPLENRVSEMCSLIDFIRPDMSEKVRKAAGMSGAPEFREMISPLYLRRLRNYRHVQPQQGLSGLYYR